MGGVSQITLGWIVSAVLIVAAVIDGRILKVPNWLTFPFLFVGLGYALGAGGGPQLWLSVQGAALGLALLLPLYAIGGMGAGDVKLFMGVGAWMGPEVTLQAFVVLAIVGAVMAVAMVAWSGEWRKHWDLFKTIVHEVLVIRDPTALSAIAAKRKPSMMLLPYGIPIAVGSIGYFAATGLLF
jgi:prepilin peptidase CpaA